MKRFLLLSISVVCLFGLAAEPSFGQMRSTRLKPKWVTSSLPNSGTSNYTFVSATGEGSSLASARQAAFVAMAQKLETERGLTINTNLQIQEKFSQTQTTTNTTYNQVITLDVTENGHRLAIVCREIDEWWIQKNGKYQIEVLYTVTDKNSSGGSYEDNITVTSRYGAAGLLSVIPGVGQMYKGDMAKGIAILVGEIAIGGGVLLCESTRASYIKKMNEQPKYASEYNSLADTWATARNICIGAAGALYVYNLIDALTANGARRVVVKQGSTQLSMQPYVDPYCVGIGVQLTFR